jgi:hypothetical protein
MYWFTVHASTEIEFHKVQFPSKCAITSTAENCCCIFYRKMCTMDTTHTLWSLFQYRPTSRTRITSNCTVYMSDLQVMEYDLPWKDKSYSDGQDIEVKVGRQWRSCHCVCLTEHHAMKAYCESGGIASRILDLDTRWRWVASFTPRPFYPPGNSPCTHRIGCWADPRVGLDMVMKRKISSPCLSHETSLSKSAIINLGIRWSCEASYTPRTLYPQGKKPPYRLQSSSGHGGKEKKSHLCPRRELNHCRPVYSLVAILTELQRLR